MLLLTLVLVAPTLATSASDAEDPRAAVRVRPTGECRVVRFSPVFAVETEPGAAKARRARRRMARWRRFSAARTLDLQFGVRVRRRVETDARLELRLYTPRGHLYQTLRAEGVAASSDSSTSDRYARLRRIFRPRTATLPVAGTAIVNHALYGRWTVEPHLDGSPTPCGRARPFWIEP
jgi:hypothetical protein